MGKQRCGSCRFFEDVGVAGSGWCHHPQRRTTGDLLILVRRNELACRDQWSRSLWEEGAFAGDGATAPAASVLPPLSHAEFARFVDREAAGPPGDSAQDVVLGEARLVGDGTPPWRRTTLDDLPLETPAPAAEPFAPDPPDHDERANLFARLPKTARRHQSSQPGDLPFIPDLAAAASLDPEDMQVAIPAGSPSPGEHLPATAVAFASDASTDEAIVEDVVAIETDDELWRDLSGDEAPSARPASGDWSEVHIALEVHPDSPLGAFEPGSRGAEAPSAASWQVDRRSSAPRERWDLVPGESGTPETARPTEPESGVNAPRAGGRFGWSRDRSGAGGLYREEGELAAVANPATNSRRTVNDDPALIAPVAPGVPYPAASETPAAAGADAHVDRWIRLDDSGSPIGGWIPEPVSVAPALPRICRTCRDFRGGEAGGSGWCANAWAFPHRQVVTADAPPVCDGAIGSWWLPSDELRIEPVDVSAHAHETPLLERWLPGQSVPERQRRRS